MSATKITDKELDRLYSSSEEMKQISSIFIKKFGKSPYARVSDYTEEFKEWLIENWLYVKDKNKIPGIKNHKLISRNAFRLDFKWAPELRFLKTFNTYLADKLANHEVKRGDIIEIEVYEHDFNLEIISISSNDCDNLPIEIDESIQLKINEDTIISFNAPKIDDEKLLKKLRDLFKVSSHVRLDMLKNILDLPLNQFIDKITEWKNEFNFEIEGDFIYFTKEDPSELIDKLEKSFALWKDSEKKTKKITYKITDRELKSIFSSTDLQFKEKLLYTLQKLEDQGTRKREDLQVGELKPIRKKKIDYGSTAVILTDRKLAALKDFDLDEIFDFFSSSDVPKRLRHYPDGIFISLLQEYNIFKKLNNALNSPELLKRQKAFNVYQLLLLKEIYPLEIKEILNENFEELAVIAKFQESAEIPFYGSQMKKDNKLRGGKYGRKINFTFEDNHITHIYIENSILKPSLAFETFNYEFLGKLKSLQSLEVQDDMFKSIPPSFKNLEKLTKLYIRSHSLKKTPDFIGLESLESLSLKCENLCEFPINISALKKLKSFSLVSIPMVERSMEQYDRFAQKTSKKGINGIPESIGELNNLISLSLMCDLIVPPTFIQHLKSLKRLGLKTNFIKEIPEWIGNLVNLERIDLSENQISFLPESFGNLNNVTDLILLHNQLQSLPESIGKLTAIKKLNLNDNEITHLPESIGKLKQLEWIHLRKNRLSELPKSIGNMSRLKTLMLGENQLIKLPETIGKLNSLESLDLFNNKLTEIPPTIGNLNSLIRLNLSKNRLSDVPKEIGNLKSLENLKLSDNQLTKMERLRDLTSLKELDLRNNHYSEIKGLEKMANLTRLYLENTKIPEKIIDELGGLRKDGSTNHPSKFIEYCKHQRNKNDIKGPRDKLKTSILENFLKEELKKIELEDDVYYELTNPEMISKNFTQILNLKFSESGFLKELLNISKKTSLLSEKYLEIIEFIKRFTNYDKNELFLKLVQVSKESDLNAHFFDIFRISEYIQDISMDLNIFIKAESFCSKIKAIKRTELFQVNYDFIERQFIEILNLAFKSKISISTSSFYTLIEEFKDTILFKKQYRLIEEKFVDFLTHGFNDLLISQDKYHYDDVEYWRGSYISSMMKKFKGTPLLKSHVKEVEDLILSFVKNEDRIQILMKELHQNMS